MRRNQYGHSLGDCPCITNTVGTVVRLRGRGTTSRLGKGVVETEDGRTGGVFSLHRTAMGEGEEGVRVGAGAVTDDLLSDVLHVASREDVSERAAGEKRLREKCDRAMGRATVAILSRMTEADCAAVLVVYGVVRDRQCCGGRMGMRSRSTVGAVEGGGDGRTCFVFSCAACGRREAPLGDAVRKGLSLRWAKRTLLLAYIFWVRALHEALGEQGYFVQPTESSCWYQCLTRGLTRRPHWKAFDGFRWGAHSIEVEHLNHVNFKVMHIDDARKAAEFSAQDDFSYILDQGVELGAPQHVVIVFEDSSARLLYFLKEVNGWLCRGRFSCTSVQYLTPPQRLERVIYPLLKTQYTLVKDYKLFYCRVAGQIGWSAAYHNFFLRESWTAEFYIVIFLVVFLDFEVLLCRWGWGI